MRIYIAGSVKYEGMIYIVSSVHCEYIDNVILKR